jgi:tetratricopeptide (TPR) repeat protein
MFNLLFQKGKNSEILNMLNTSASGKGTLAPYAEYRKNYYYFRKGDYQKSLDIIKNISFPSNDTQIDKTRLYDMGLINYSCLGNKSAGMEYFNKLVSEYPDDILSDIACNVYGVKKEIKDNNKTTITENISGTALLANFPNPFNPSTIIKYNIGENTLVTLKVCDVLGREVTTLVNEYKTKGAYEVKFNGNGLASGLYFTKLQAGSTTLIQKMILTK